MEIISAFLLIFVIFNIIISILTYGKVNNVDFLSVIKRTFETKKQRGEGPVSYLPRREQLGGEREQSGEKEAVLPTPKKEVKKREVKPKGSLKNTL